MAELLVYLSRSNLMVRSALIFTFFVSFVFSTNDSKAQNAEAALLELLSPQQTGVEFVNKNDTTQDQYFSFARPPRLYYKGGAGVAIADLNGDGLQDIFLVSNLGENKYFENKGRLKFVDKTGESGLGGNENMWSRGVAVLDINKDGKLDLYVTNSAYAGKASGVNELFINKGNGKFEEKALEYGLADGENSFQSSFFDYDRDGDLDLFLITHIEEEVGGKAFHSANRIKNHCQRDKLYRNDSGKFVDVTETSGIENCALALNALTTDFNQDGWPDVFISNDFIVPDRIFLNNQDGTFREASEELFDHYSFSSMGSDVGDFNNDGLVDLITLDMLPEENLRQKVYSGMIIPKSYYRLAEEGLYYQNQRNCLYLNSGVGYSEIGQLAGIYKTDWSWGAAFVDLDNDMYQDLVVSNTGMFNALALEYGLGSKVKKESFLNAKLETTLANYVFRNNANLTFENKQDSWGFDKKINSTGFAYGDLDNDGDMDLVFNNLNEPVSIYENTAASKSGFIQFVPQDKKSIDFGATVQLHSGNQHPVNHILTSRGYLSSPQPVAHFGLPKGQKVDSVTVRWSDGTISVHRGFEQDKKHIIQKKKTEQIVSLEPVTIFNQLDTFGLGIMSTHKENGLEDFYYEKLLPHALSKLGPGIAVADLNGDLSDDVVVGAASGHPTEIFLQPFEGPFEKQFSGKAINDNLVTEDMAILPLDADSDGDIDLFIAAGGYNMAEGNPNYNNRLYLNDGKGGFTEGKGRIPKDGVSASCAVSADFDQDGDQDIFVGARARSGQYPETPHSALLLNQGGIFVDVTDSLAPGLKLAGMVTSALWTDYDNDADMDLIVVGEWTEILVFNNDKGKLTRATESASLAGMFGWWNSISGADFDDDGDIDYVVGNLGQNNKFGVSYETPLQVHYNDFDGDSRGDVVLSYHQKKQVVPVRGRVCSSAQMPLLKDQFGTSRAFGESNLFDIYDNDRLDQSLKFKANEFRSVYLNNLGNGKFEVLALPVEAQFAPVFGTVINDYTGDGNLDVLLVGNNLSVEVETGAYDALKGLLLAGNGNGQFQSVPNTISGLNIKGDAKAIVQVLNSGETGALILVTRNDDRLIALTNPLPNSTNIRFNSDVSHGFVELKNGKKRYFELNNGGGYLSVSSHCVSVPKDAVSIEYFDSKGNSSTYKIN